MIPYGKQVIEQDDIDAVISVLKSDFLTQGPLVQKFEEEISHYVNSKFSLALNSATSALHVSCLALGLGEKDELWTSPISFVASSNCALYCGATVDFVDIEPNTYNLCPNKLEDKLKKGGRPKVVVPVHFSGQSCDMEAIKYLGDKYNFKIIEDASHAIGGEYKNSKVGSCEFSDITVFSFHPVKIITTGEGGVITTNQKELFDKITLLRSHGITRNRDIMLENHGAWYYEQIDLGYNYRMTDIQSALGLSQMRKIDKFIEKRTQIAYFYNSHLPSEVSIPYQSPKQKSSFHLYVITVDHRDIVFNHLQKNGIGVNVHYIPIHLHPYYQRIGFKLGDFPIAESYYNRCISLPLHPSLSDQDMQHIVQSIKQIVYADYIGSHL
jgi:UDP-4-amino-4,6-dideoxy-N-acetyl-beta-L-altrosamine transaminase